MTAISTAHGRILLPVHFSLPYEQKVPGIESQYHCRHTEFYIVWHLPTVNYFYNKASISG